MADESVLDQWNADWLKANGRQIPMKDIYQMARPKESPWPVTRELAHVADDVVADVPVRIYRGAGRPTGLVVSTCRGRAC
ncbi:hypothetical protein O1M63_03760 [Streptomyces mirabilis]|nr:hypothetical protein [Streptomyces mirabilis]